MKWIIPAAVAVALTATGCLSSLPNLREQDKPTTSVARSAAPVPPVTADMITEKNAHDKARELRAEMDREAARAPGSALER